MRYNGNGLIQGLGKLFYMYMNCIRGNYGGVDMKKILGIISIITLILIITACENQKTIDEIFSYDDGDTHITYSKEFTNVKGYEGEAVEAKLDDLMYYLNVDRNLPNVQAARIYWSGDDISFDLYLNSDATRDEILRCKDFFTSFALEANREGLGYGSAISQIFYSNSSKFDNRIMNLYIDDILLVRSRFKLRGAQITDYAYFENVLYGEKYLKPADIDITQIKDKLKQVYSLSNIEAFKTLDYKTLLVKLEFNEFTSDEELSGLTSIVMKEFIDPNKEKLGEDDYENVILCILVGEQTVYMGEIKIGSDV